MNRTIWLFDRALRATAAASYLNSAALVILGFLTSIIGLFKSSYTAQIGGIGVILVAAALATTTLAAVHSNRRSTR